MEIEVDAIERVEETTSVTELGMGQAH